MKISNTPPNYINQTYANQSNSAAQKQSSQKLQEETSTAPPSDSINLSGRTKALQKVSQAIEAEPADRQKYVSEIKQRVETNQYNINVEAVAEKVVGTLMDDMV